MGSTPNFFALHGLGGRSFDAQAVWREKESTGSLTIPIGEDPGGSPVVVDFTRWTSLDDHVAVVGAPGAGTTTVLRTVMLGLSLSRSPDLVTFLVAEGKAGGREYADAPELPHCTGHVTFTHDKAERLAGRLAKVLLGEVDRREVLLRNAGVASVDDYRHVLKTRPGIEPMPDTFIILDDITWLRPAFDTALSFLVARGHRLGMRLVVGIPAAEWLPLSQAGVVDGFSARIAVGLSKEQASSVLAAHVPDDSTTGHGYVTHLGGEPVRVTLVSTDSTVD